MRNRIKSRKPKTKKTKSTKTKTRNTRNRNTRNRNTRNRNTRNRNTRNRNTRNRNRRIRGGAAAVRPLETYVITNGLKEIMDRTREIVRLQRHIEERDLLYDTQTRVRLEKETIYLVAKKIASVLRDRTLGLPGAANYLNNPIIHYLKQLYANIINQYQSNEYRTVNSIENEFNLENGDNSNDNGGYMELYEIFEDDDTDDEILAMIDEFNQQP
jgi:hypothetical protein